MKKPLFLLMLIVFLSSFNKEKTLKGTWEYQGGIFRGKHLAAPVDYSQQRKYTNTKFDAFLIEKGEKTQKYESGNYTLNGDTCLETQTFSLQESKLIGITVHYLYTIRNDTLILKGTLPDGMVAEDYWKRIK